MCLIIVGDGWQVAGELKEYVSYCKNDAHENQNYYLGWW
jgi:hypothetical protein